MSHSKQWDRTDGRLKQHNTNSHIHSKHNSVSGGLHTITMNGNTSMKERLEHCVLKVTASIDQTVLWHINTGFVIVIKG